MYGGIKGSWAGCEEGPVSQASFRPSASKMKMGVQRQERQIIGVQSGHSWAWIACWTFDETHEETRMMLTDRWSPHNRNIIASTSYDMTCRS